MIIALLPVLLALTGPCVVPDAVTAPGVFTADVVRQEGDWEYVPDAYGFVSLFEGACERGSTGLLAHDFLTGKDFYNLTVGRRIFTTGGQVTAWRVVSIRRFYFMDDRGYLAEQGGAPVWQSDLFEQIYVSGTLVLQTCLSDSYGSGLLFVTAVPEPGYVRLQSRILKAIGDMQ